MGFTELSHAFIAAKYYVYLKEIFGDRGEAAFLHATRYYGEQRGRRMAQRAIRDGKPLTYETYCQYGEWVNTEEVANMKIKLNPDQEIVNTIREGLKRTGGYCPCRRERTEATKCMCQEFKDQIADPGFEGFCHCMLYYKSLQD